MSDTGAVTDASPRSDLTCHDCMRMMVEQREALERLRAQVELIRQAWLQVAHQLAVVVQHCGITHSTFETIEGMNIRQRDGE